MQPQKKGICGYKYLKKNGHSQVKVERLAMNPISKISKRMRSEESFHQPPVTKKHKHVKVDTSPDRLPSGTSKMSSYMGPTTDTGKFATYDLMVAIRGIPCLQDYLMLRVSNQIMGPN